MIITILPSSANFHAVAYNEYLQTKAVYYKFLWLNFNFNLLTISLQPFSMALKQV